MMREQLLYTDHPVLVPQGKSLPPSAWDGLYFSRALRVSFDALMEQLADPMLRHVWLKPMKGSQFTITHAAPAQMEATETDGTYAVHITITCEDDGDLTSLHVQVEPLAPITTTILIASGYTDHWEERLYALTDALLIHSA